MLLHRHRVVTLFNKDGHTGWSVWYSKTPTPKEGNEIESREFAEDQVKRLGSSKSLGSLYKEKHHEHIRY